MSRDLSIVAYAPVIRQSIDSFHETLVTQNEQYTITEGIGFDAASFELVGAPAYLIDWYEHGLIRDVVWLAPDGGVAWHGYVSRLTLNLGDVARVESIDPMANRVKLVYTPLDTTTNPPEAGAQTSIVKNDAASQARYGIKSAVLSGNDATAATADDEAFAALKKLATIKYDQTISIGQGKGPSLVVEMRGYAHMVDWNFYEQTAVSETDNAHTIIVAVLAADPNGIIYSSDVNVDTNTTQIQKYFDGKQTAWKIVQDITARGRESGSEGWPWTCGVYEGRRVWYKAREALDAGGNPESTNKYLPITHHIHERGDWYTDDAGREVPSWQMRPDRLVYTSGVPGAPMYVTQVAWSAPGKVMLRGEAAVNPLRRDNRMTPPEDILRLRSWFFAKDEDVTLITGRKIVLPDGTEIPSSAIVPVGGIILWSGSVVSIPAGWQLCNGTNGTPDLRGKFIPGAGGAYAPGDTGGSDSVNSSHTHADGTLAADAGGSHTHPTDVGGAHTHAPGTLATDSEPAHTHGPGSLSTGNENIEGVGPGVTRDALLILHTHAVDSGATASGGSHAHAVDSGATASGGSHDHTATAAGSHSHGVSGSTATGGSAALENRPAFYALAYIQRLS